jgi:hypothetical protein
MTKSRLPEKKKVVVVPPTPEDEIYRREFLED